METVQSPRRHAPINFSSSAFVGTHEGRYRDIWSILGQEWDNRFLAAAWAVNTIPGPEHGILNPNFMLSDEQREAIFPILASMKWFFGMQLLSGKCDHLLMTGAKYRAMIDRALAMIERLTRTEGKPVTFRHIWGQFGQRPREDKIDGTVIDIYDALPDNVKYHPWVIEQMSLQNESGTYELFNGPFATEFELGILAILVAADGDVIIGDYAPCSDAKNLPGVPARTVESCKLTLANGQEITAINCPAVERDYGPPRPTSISTTEHLLQTCDISEGETIVVVTVRIHGPRIVGDVERVIHSVHPGVKVLGFSQSVSGDPRKYINHALAESVNQLVKWAEETFNAMCPTGSKPIDLKRTRQLLNRIHANPTAQTVACILVEVTCGLVPA
ncbi:MAG TPA: hypothetical protein VLF59_05410 [Candidatus Saccharimonadales bacterium]|nr:hypothetical protein [Candidatus Saccharimonadales bacterium]